MKPYHKIQSIFKRDEVTIYEAIEYTKTGFKSRWRDFDAEGLVLRSDCVLLRRNGDRVITN